jgi:signal transduction histidine kinase
LEKQDITNIKLLITVGILITLFLAAVIIIFVVYYQRKMLLKNAELKIMEQEKQLELFKATVEAEEKQKEKIARNLHDEINPILTVLKLNLSKHKIDIFKEKFNIEDLTYDQQILDKVIDGIRTTCLDLIPTFLLEYGLIKSLESYINSINSNGEIDAEFENKNQIKNLDYFNKQVQLNIYRVSLEILNNLFKHANCTILKLDIDMLNNQFIIKISHNGEGVTNEEMDFFTESSKGLGLKSLKTRTLILNANINYSKSINNSIIKLTIPYQNV